MKGLIRCCGTRSEGGIYLETLLSPFGRPVEEFLVDPPIPVDPDQLRITPRGVRLIPRDGVYHVYDWIGSKFYPNCADFVEEVRYHGLSRRAEGIDYSKITPASRLVLLHKRAYVKNFVRYGPRIDKSCPKCLQNHFEGKEMCVKLWWEDIEGGERINENERVVRRDMPSISYFGLDRPDKVKPKYQLAIFAIFPISRIAVINDPDGGQHVDALQEAKNARIPVKLVEE